MLTIDAIERLLHLLHVLRRPTIQRLLHHRLLGTPRSPKGRLQAGIGTQAHVDLNQAMRSSQQGDKAIGELLHQGLALMHTLYFIELGQPFMGDLNIEESARQDANYLASTREHAIRYAPHQAYARATIDQANASRRHFRAERIGRFLILRPVTCMRATVDTYPLQNLPPGKRVFIRATRRRRACVG